MQQRPLFGPNPSAIPEKESPAQAPSEASRKVYTVSELNSEFKFLLESTYPSIWVEGEISNFTQHGVSGHYYFCLKDEKSQIKAVMWKSNHRYLKWRPANGMKVLLNGRVTLYEPSGNYQLDVLQIIQHGKGDLHVAFEQLKEKLKTEGLFDPKRKRPIPMLPQKIGIVTSPTGAAIKDILNILNRRFLNLHVLIYPAKVQGEEAAPTIAEGIRVLNRFKDIDVLIVGRGGGSIEDLWPFNEELVARAIVSSRIPVISAVGHEIDTTISDFAADLRAPTPSAAAELVIGKKSELIDKVLHLSKRLNSTIQHRFLDCKHNVQILSQHRALAGFPQRIHTQQQMVDDYETRVRNGLYKFHNLLTRRLLVAGQKLNAGQLRHLIEVKRSLLNGFTNALGNHLRLHINNGRSTFLRLAGNLDSLSPLAVLERGYSISSKEDGAILKQGNEVKPGEKIRVRLYRGKLKCEVTEVENE
jgi:exodeoxyribonuclease VII large subunit